MPFNLIIQVIGVVCVLAGVAPGNMHLAHVQVNYQRVDGFFAVKRVQPCNVVVANGVGNINMILLNGL